MFLAHRISFNLEDFGSGAVLAVGGDQLALALPVKLKTMKRTFQATFHQFTQAKFDLAVGARVFQHHYLSLLVSPKNQFLAQPLYGFRLARFCLVCLQDGIPLIRN
jgi:hypothetical protein